MGLRPGHCYCKNVKQRAFTRVAKKVHRKNFVGGIPGLKIRQFHMGTGDRPYTHVVHYVTSEKVQIRDNALESIRVTITRQLTKKLTIANYYMKLRVYPQFFLRENKQAQGAHADRIQMGMSQCPFGKVIGVASRVRVNQKILSVLVDEANVPTVVAILDRCDSKVPGRMKVIVEKNESNFKSVGTVKKKRRMIKDQQEEDLKNEAAKAAGATPTDGKTPAAATGKPAAGAKAPAAAGKPAAGAKPAAPAAKGKK
ncbi:MAG: 50S ribosomal protein L16 [archaeon]